MCLIHCPITQAASRLSASMAFISLGITWSKYWKHRDAKVGQDLGKHPDMYNDANQFCSINQHTAFPPPQSGQVPEQTQLCLDSCLMSLNTEWGLMITKSLWKGLFSSAALVIKWCAQLRVPNGVYKLCFCFFFLAVNKHLSQMTEKILKQTTLLSLVRNFPENSPLVQVPHFIFTLCYYKCYAF